MPSPPPGFDLSRLRSIVTPVEVVFMQPDRTVTPLWVVNRLIDLFFTADCILIFNTARAPHSLTLPHAPSRSALDTLAFAPLSLMR